LRRPSLDLAIAFNRAVRQDDEWFDEPDELDRVERALAAIDGIEDPVHAAGVLAYRITRAQGFSEGNKRTALLLARWVLDRNGIDGTSLIPPDDRDLADLLVQAASGADVEAALVELLRGRQP
jgi:prophage maintenance system killer protein